MYLRLGAWWKGGREVSGLKAILVTFGVSLELHCLIVGGSTLFDLPLNSCDGAEVVSNIRRCVDIFELMHTVFVFHLAIRIKFCKRPCLLSQAGWKVHAAKHALSVLGRSIAVQSLCPRLAESVAVLNDFLDSTM